MERPLDLRSEKERSRKKKPLIPKERKKEDGEDNPVGGICPQTSPYAKRFCHLRRLTGQ